jgi:hypothetical protein
MSYSSTWPSEPHLSGLFEGASVLNHVAYSPARANEEFCVHALGDFLAPALIQVVRLMALLPLHPPDEISSQAERQEASRAVYTIELPLTTYRALDRSEILLVAFSEMFQAAAQLYILLALRDLPIHAPKISRWAHTLARKIGEVQDVGITGGQKTNARVVLLWSYAVLVSARPDPSSGETWIAFHRVKEPLIGMGLLSMKILKLSLTQITWADDFGDEGLGRLLAAIERSNYTGGSLSQ